VAVKFFRRLSQLIQVYYGLANFLEKCYQSRHNSQKLVRLVNGYCDGFIRPIQVDGEIVQLMDRVRDLSPKVVLEIGTHWGGTLLFWTHVSAKDALIISCDLPGGDFGGGYSEARVPLYKGFALKGQTMELIRADSHSPDTLAKIHSILGDRSVDFLFIDGDHTYDGVKADFEMYSGLVRPGGIIALHDIASSYDRTEVERFWKEVKVGRESEEFILGSDGLYGIGMLRV